MIVGTVKEIKIHEYRVGLTPASVRAYVTQGHRVIVETGAGEGIGFSDVSYVESGGEIVSEAAEVFATADMVVKVKAARGSDLIHLPSSRCG
jgi:alanine dehydrogenase